MILDNNVKKVKNRAFLQFLVKGCMEVKVAQLQNFLFFWKYNGKPLTHIFNLARRQIQKKLCRPFKLSHFLGKFGQKIAKNAISSIKMVKNYHFQVSFMIRPLCLMKSIYTSGFSEKNFFEVGQLHYPLSPSKRIYKIYILRIFWSCQNFKMKLPNFKIFSFSKTFVFAL